MIPLAVFIFLPYPHRELGQRQPRPGPSTTRALGGWKGRLAWLCVMGWSAYGVETCAHVRAGVQGHGARHDPCAPLVGDLLVVRLRPPPSGSAVLTQQEIADNPIAFYVPAFDEILVGGRPT